MKQTLLATYMYKCCFYNYVSPQEEFKKGYHSIFIFRYYVYMPMNYFINTYPSAMDMYQTELDFNKVKCQLRAK